MIFKKELKDVFKKASAKFDKFIDKYLDKFLFASVPASSLGLVRILVAFIMLLNWIFTFSDVVPFLGPSSYFSKEASVIYRYDTWSLLFWLPDTYLSIYSVLVVGAFSTVCVLIGWRTRFFAWMSFLLLLSTQQRNVHILNSGDNVLRLFALFLALTPSGCAYSIDSFRSKISKTVPAWSLRLFQVQICLIYFVAAITKILGKDWRNGTAVYYATRVEWFWRLRVPHFLDQPILYTVIAYLTIVIELGFPFFIWFKGTRKIFWWSAVCLHLGIELLMNTQSFQAIMLAGLAAF